MMGNPRRKPIYVIVGDAVVCIGNDRILDFDAEPVEPLVDELQCPAADEVLAALRKSFSLTFPENFFIKGLTEALAEIRRVCVEALRELPEVLEELKLPPIPPVSDGDPNGRVKVVSCHFARAADLRIQIKFNGKTRGLLRLLQPISADAVIRAARETITATFTEMHSEEQHETVLRQIRDKIWNVLPPFNEYLSAIEFEPIAEKIDDTPQ